MLATSQTQIHFLIICFFICILYNYPYLSIYKSLFCNTIKTKNSTTSHIMSSSHSTARRLSKQRTKHSPTKSTMLPKAVRDELRMCVALRGYSTIRGGFGKKLEEQFVLMQEFFHGKSTHTPSQIKMLVDGQLAYAALYDTKNTVVTSKKTKTKKKKDSPVQLYLKPSLTCIDNMQFVQYVDITVDDLERKLRKGKAILHGRQLEAMAKKD